jgi:hypothetical protein
MAMRITTKDLGAVNDGVADDGAILTAAIAAQFGTVGTGLTHFPIEIDFGDLTYNMNSPLVIQQNQIIIVGDPTFHCNNIAHAVQVDVGGALALIFGTKVRGAIAGTCTGDAVLVQQASQCEVDIRINGAVAGAAVHFQACYSCRSRVHCDGEGDAAVAYGHKETVLAVNGVEAVSHNSTIDVLCYFGTQSGVHLEESQGFRITGDIELMQGPAVDLVDTQNGFVGVYTEKNGSGASGVGDDIPADIRLRHSPNWKVSNAALANTILGSRVGGEQINVNGTLVTPASVHIVSGIVTKIMGSVLGGDIVLGAGADQTLIEPTVQLGGTIVDAGTNTIDRHAPGKAKYKAAGYNRFLIDAYGPNGPVIGSPDNLFGLFGVKSLSTGNITGHNFAGYVDISGANTGAQVSFPSPEPDAYLAVQLTASVIGGSPPVGALRPSLSSLPLVTGFPIQLEAAPGAGNSVRVYWMVIRVN